MLIEMLFILGVYHLCMIFFVKKANKLSDEWFFGQLMKIYLL